MGHVLLGAPLVHGKHVGLDVSDQPPCRKLDSEGEGALNDRLCTLCFGFKHLSC